MGTCAQTRVSVILSSFAPPNSLRTNLLAWVLFTNPERSAGLAAVAMDEVLERLKAMEGWGARLENLEEQGEHLGELLQEVLRTLQEQPVRCVPSQRGCPPPREPRVPRAPVFLGAARSHDPDRRSRCAIAGASPILWQTSTARPARHRAWVHRWRLRRATDAAVTWTLRRRNHLRASEATAIR